MANAPDTIPATAVPWAVSLAGLAGFVVGVVAALQLSASPALALVALVGLTGLPMWWMESRRHRRDDASRPPDISCPTLRQRREWRFRGLLVATPVWMATLSVLPLANGGTISAFWDTLGVLWPLLVLGLPTYVWRPQQGAPHGLELAGRWWTHRDSGDPFPWHVVRDQLVKAFFLPLMVAFAFDWMSRTNPWSSGSSQAWFLSTLAVLYLVDTTFGTIGYLSTARRFDAHIRSSNPHLLAWAAALVCYPPFFTWLQRIGFNYRDGYEWTDWLDLSGTVFYLWGGAILVLSGVYALSTVVFGIRFSNLTHRGILTHGPYRWTKHPAYLSKNLSWWLISVPFISSAGTGTALLHCAILLGVNAIYWLRAKTEERHLLSDPVYRQYADWIARNGLFARVRRVMSLEAKPRWLARDP